MSDSSEGPDVRSSSGNSSSSSPRIGSGNSGTEIEVIDVEKVV